MTVMTVMAVMTVMTGGAVTPEASGWWGANGHWPDNRADDRAGNHR